MTPEEPLPRRVLAESDLRALAHPLRLRLLELLHEAPSTASRLARRVGESSGATSYHLRILARYGFVEETNETHSGRERWWRIVPQTTEIPAGTEGSEDYRAAAAQVRSAHLERGTRVLAAFLREEQQYPPEWRETALFLQATIFATPAELKDLAERIVQLLEPLTRVDDADRPPGAERVHVTTRALPWWL